MAKLYKNNNNNNIIDDFNDIQYRLRQYNVQFYKI